MLTPLCLSQCQLLCCKLGILISCKLGRPQLYILLSILRCMLIIFLMECLAKLIILVDYKLLGNLLGDLLSNLLHFLVESLAKVTKLGSLFPLGNVVLDRLSSTSPL